MDFSPAIPQEVLVSSSGMTRDVHSGCCPLSISSADHGVADARRCSEGCLWRGCRGDGTSPFDDDVFRKTQKQTYTHTNESFFSLSSERIMKRSKQNETNARKKITTKETFSQLVFGLICSVNHTLSSQDEETNRI